MGKKSKSFFDESGLNGTGGFNLQKQKSLMLFMFLNKKLPSPQKRSSDQASFEKNKKSYRVLALSARKSTKKFQMGLREKQKNAFFKGVICFSRTGKKA